MTKDEVVIKLEIEELQFIRTALSNYTLPEACPEESIKGHPLYFAKMFALAYMSDELIEAVSIKDPYNGSIRLNKKSAAVLKLIMQHYSANMPKSAGTTILPIDTLTGLRLW